MKPCASNGRQGISGDRLGGLAPLIRTIGVLARPASGPAAGEVVGGEEAIPASGCRGCSVGRQLRDDEGDAAVGAVADLERPRDSPGVQFAGRARATRARGRPRSRARSRRSAAPSCSSRSSRSWSPVAIRQPSIRPSTGPKTAKQARLRVDRAAQHPGADPGDDHQRQSGQREEPEARTPRDRRRATGAPVRTAASPPGRRW